MAYELGGLYLICKVGPMPGLEAELTIADLVFQARTPGAAGNSLTMTYATGGTAGAEVVTVTGQDISVQIDDGNSTAQQIKTALDNFPAAFALIQTAILGLPDAAQSIFAKTSFAFGYDPTTYPQMFAGLQTKKLTLGAEAIDVSNHDSQNYKTILDKAGLRSFSLEAGGVATKTATFNMVSIICEKDLLQEFLLVDIDNQITRRGKFKISSLDLSADFKSSQAFSMKLESSGRLSKNVATAQEMDPTI
jgi:predicted secreted protein